MPRPIYSDEVQEIMGRIPGRVVRWGISVIFSIFVILLGVAYFFKYPEIVTSSIVLTTTNPPTELIARSTGKVEHILVENGQSVLPNELIAVLFSTADYRSVLQLEKVLSDSLFSLNTERGYFENRTNLLGELQPHYTALEKTCKSYSHYMQTGAIPQQKIQIEQQIKMLYAGLRAQEKQLEILQRDLRFERNNQKRDSVLFHSHALTEADYDASVQKLLQKELSVTSQQSSIISTKNDILSQEKQLTDLTIQYDNEQNEFQLQFEEQRTQLLAEIRLWKDKYILNAPIAGKITFTKYWAENQNITIEDRLATIVSEDSTQIIGRITIPSSGLGKVEVGQQVNVKLNGFPYMEYGLLKGRLISISSVPETINQEEIGYIGEVAFPQGMVSSYKNKFRFIQQMDGTAEIITKDTRLIERFVQPIESLFKNH
mgnify:FL=1